MRDVVGSSLCVCVGVNAKEEDDLSSGSKAKTSEQALAAKPGEKEQQNA